MPMAWLSVYINSQHLRSIDTHLVFPSVFQYERSVLHFRSSCSVVGSQPHDAVAVLVHGGHFPNIASEGHSCYNGIILVIIDKETFFCYQPQAVVHTVVDVMDVADRADVLIFRLELGHFVGKRVYPRHDAFFLTYPQASIIVLGEAERFARSAVSPHFKLHVGRQGIALALPQSVVLGSEPDVSLCILRHPVDVLDLIAQYDAVELR